MSGFFLPTICFYFVFTGAASAAAVDGPRGVVAIDEHSVCNVKASCVDCLSLEHCGWCIVDNKCFAPKLEDEGFCNNDTLFYEDRGLSVGENAACVCDENAMEKWCKPAGAPDDAADCSGRGTCLCGRCNCTSSLIFDPQHPTKMVVGDYCEFDNFSCDGAGCGEGPYPLSPPEEQPADGVSTAEDYVVAATDVPSESDVEQS